MMKYINTYLKIGIVLALSALWAAALAYGTTMYAQQWLSQTHQRVLVRINSHQEPPLAQPVFAQFIFTQTLELPHPALVTHLEVPLYIPEGGQQLRIILRQDGQELVTWQTPTDATGVVPVDLLFPQPTPLSGRFELEFNGSEIDHGASDSAPRVFTETQNAAYPHGNYRIAANEKEGDIGLAIYEQVSNKELFIERYTGNKPTVIADLLLKLAALLVVYMFPFVLVRSFVRSY